MKPGCSVFVGNIDFEVPVDKLIDELGAVGKVVDFKLMVDKNTNKSKGFGFCEYESPLIAEKAIKQLNISFNNRPVVINYAEKDGPTEQKEETGTLDINNIINVLNNMDADNLKEVILYLKNLSISQPTYFKELLSKNPELVYALVYSLKLLKLVDDSLIKDFIKQSFKIKDNKLQILERIRSINDDELQTFPDDVKEKILYLRNSLFRKKE
ncbi:RRM domain-containing protein [Vairimorpha necatrix]|uniref:RRM domain-containing protein n=1 Tax=Vairimorpha necatrix TaxID=6039 RepID=A0AAX4J991_9MICR